MNYKKMVEDIDNLVQNDFCTDVFLKMLPDSKQYTQKEAKKMAETLSRVYSISHCLTCEACGAKYKINI
jgi:hypothetical protein